MAKELPHNVRELQKRWSDLSESGKRASLRSIGCGNGKDQPKKVTMQCDFFAEFMRRKGNQSTQYLGSSDDWARRFSRGEQFHFADRDNKTMLFDIMVEGTADGNARHINEKDLDILCSKR